MEPKVEDFQFLQEITGNFSEERIIGRNLHANVYKGVIRHGKVLAVKILHEFKPGLNNICVKDDFRKLSMLKHPNLVRFKGYCHDVPEGYAEKTSTSLLKEKGITIAACSEYLDNGSLQEHLSDEFTGFDWHTRYKIIGGVCKGLNYLHKQAEYPVYHMNIKPEKIFLDKNMVPKLSILCLVKFLCADLSEIERIPYESIKHYPPEYMQENIVSDKLDVFSLGVLMIEIVTGPMGYTKAAHMSAKEFLALAEQNWRIRLQETCSSSKLNLCCQQVKRCIQIALSCVDNDRHKRPSITEIIYKLVINKGYIPQMDVSGWKDEVAPGLFEVLPYNEDFASRMDDDIYIDLNFLARAIGGIEKPRNIKLRVLQLITKNFSDELKIGHGGCGVVYKGILQNRIVAVKRLFNSRTIEDKMFHQEVTSMMMVKHQNIVRFLGYCSHTEEQVVEMAGIIKMAETRERLLCLEYINNGSLENHLTDELRGLEWHTRYQIIKGICEGLQHLHKEKHIIHMDLKPANILLDDNMVPKITDFGLSRIDEKSQTTSKERLISLGYCAPEYQYNGKMSAKSDIYSLGVIIIELITGSKETPSLSKVLRRWRHRWNKSTEYTPSWDQQVTKCLELALSCKHTEPIERPNIWEITCELDKMDGSDVVATDMTESTTSDQIIPCLDSEGLLGIEPLDMHLHLELNKKISCSVELTNDTDGYFAFRISTTSLRSYCIHPDKDIIPPRSQRSIAITLQEVEKAPSRSHCRDEFSVQSTRIDDGSLKGADITRDMFHEEPGKVVDTVNLMVILDTQE